jgi:hypothetical protein
MSSISEKINFVDRTHEAERFRLYLSGGRTIMDRVSESLLNEFSESRELSHLAEDKRFEHFVAFITVSQHYGNTFDTDDVLVGESTGIDAIAIIVNGNLVTDIEELDEADIIGELDVTFVIVQADRSPSFDTGKIGNFGFAALDFFKEQPELTRNKQLIVAAEIMTEVYKRANKFKRGNPACRLYYATTGKWTADVNLDARRRTVVSDLEETHYFREVTFTPLGADGIQKLYMQTKNAISREFTFDKYLAIPELPGVTQAYLGYLPIPEFRKIVVDGNGEIIGSLFYSNPRDWQDYNKVNLEIKNTLDSDAKNRFVLMNNGITIIARKITQVAYKFIIEDYQIVNGCQTSHVLVDQTDKADGSVMVPIRLIGTTDENIINSIIRATNRQTEVTEDQFFALQDFPKQLETFFEAFPDQRKLYYERRPGQYARFSIEKTRIITQPNVIKSFAAMFLDEAHRTMRNYGAVKAKVGKEIFGKDHRKEPYYYAAFAYYKLEFFFRTQILEPKFKPARFHILFAMRLLGNPEPLPPMNSHEMGRYCDKLINTLYDSVKADELITNAASVIDEIAAANFERDNIRTEPFTKGVSKRCKEIIEHGSF